MKKNESLSDVDFGEYKALRQTMLDSNFNSNKFGTLESCFRSHLDVPPLVPLKLLPALRVLHISNNNIERFTYQNILVGAPNLTEIDLSHNKIKILDDLIELGALKDLQNLDLTGNPVMKAIPRIRIIEYLLFPKKYTTHNGVKILTAGYVNIVSENKSQEEPGPKSPQYIEGEAPVESEPGPQRKLRYNNGRTLIRRGMKECPVPRKTRFPMLRILSEKIISIQDVESVLAGGSVESILVSRDEIEHNKHKAKTKSVESVTRVNKAMHEKYVERRKRKNEREFVMNAKNFMLGEPLEKVKDRNVYDLLIQIDRARSQERASEKKQVSADFRATPYDITFKDSELHINMEEFKEMSQKREDKKREADNESLIRKKQYLQKLRSLKSNKYYDEKSRPESPSLTKEEIKEINEIYNGIYKNGVMPKVNLSQEKFYESIQSSESNLEEASEQSLRQNSLTRSDISFKSDEEKDKYPENPIDLPHEMLKHFVNDVATGKYRKDAHQKERKEDLTPLKKESLTKVEENALNSEGFKILLRLSSQLGDERSKSPMPPRVKILENFEEMTQRLKLQEIQNEKPEKQENSFRKKRTFAVKTKSSPNLSLPFQTNLERNLIDILYIPKPKETESPLDRLSPIGKVTNSVVNVEWEDQSALLQDETQRKGGYEYKGDISVLKSVINGTAFDHLRPVNIKILQEEQAGTTGRSQNRTPTTPERNHKKGIPGAEGNFYRIMATKSRIRMLRSRLSEKSRSHTRDASPVQSQTPGRGVSNDRSSSPIGPGISNEALESTRRKKEMLLKKRIEKLKQKQKDMFEPSSKAQPRQENDSRDTSPYDSSKTSRDKATQANSQSSSVLYTGRHYQGSRLMNPTPEGHISLKDLNPPTASHLPGLNSSSLYSKQASLPPEKKRDDQNDLLKIVKEYSSGFESSKLDRKSSMAQEKSDQQSYSTGSDKGKKSKSANRDSKIIINPSNEASLALERSKIQRLLVEELLPEGKDGLSERQRLKILTEKGEKFESLLATAKLLEQMEMLLTEANNLNERIEIKGGRRRWIREPPNLKKELRYGDLAQLVRQRNKSESLGAKDMKTLREYLHMAYKEENGKKSTLSPNRIETLSKELKQKMMNGDDWAVDSASYQLSKLDQYCELEGNLRIAKELAIAKGMPGYLDKIEREEILRVQGEAVMAVHTARIQKYHDDTYMRKYYRDGMKALEDIRNDTSSVKTIHGEDEISQRLSSIFERDHVKSPLKKKERKIETDRGKRNEHISEEEMMKNFVDNFKDDIVKRKELKKRMDTYIKEGRKTIDEFLENQRLELEKIHDKKGAFQELIRLTWENKV